MTTVYADFLNLSTSFWKKLGTNFLARRVGDLLRAECKAEAKDPVPGGLLPGRKEDFLCARSTTSLTLRFSTMLFLSLRKDGFRFKIYVRLVELQDRQLPRQPTRS
jgi:hypothetical protein